MKLTKVEKNRHWFWPRLSNKIGFRPFSLEFQVRFQQKYFLKYPENLQINKIFGIGKNHHQLESARFGFKLTEDSSYYHMEIWAYGYEKGMRIERLLTRLPLGETITLKLEHRDNSFIYYINNNKVFIQESRTRGYIYYALNPYFGGSTKAPYNFSFRYAKVKR